MTFELFYASGGHGGPHPSYQAAVDHATKLLMGSSHEISIHVHPRIANGVGGFGPRVATVSICRFPSPGALVGAISVDRLGMISVDRLGAAVE